jgi:predicted cupin superfamily sugar epimerase
MQTAHEWIQTLQLVQHPEGGWYREVYRSPDSIPGQALPARFGADRRYATSIYFLLQHGDFSAFHRIRQDEMWHFYDGDPLRLHAISPSGDHHTIVLGRNLELGQQLTAVVPAGWWFGAEVADSGSFCLVGCTVAPGFEFEDLEIADRQELLDQYAHLAAVIHRLTRP